MTTRHFSLVTCECCGAPTYAPSGCPPVPSALRRFTSRFGMGRSGPTALRAHHWLRVVHSVARTPASLCRPHSRSFVREALVHALCSPARLAALPASAALPVLSWGTYLAVPVSGVILRRISHLDAFSGSCCRP